MSIYRYFLIACILIGTIEIEYISAGVITPEKVKSETKHCMDARESQTESTITEYVCPSGEFLDVNGKDLSKEVLSCTIKMWLEFNEIDKDAILWTKELQKQREKDPLKWSEDIQKKVYDNTDSLRNRYLNVCAITEWKDCAVSTDFHPETTCNDRAEAKAAAWRDMGYILAGKGIAKSYQNDKDTYIDATKSAYDTLVKKWNEYKRIVDRAVSKFTAYIKNAVK